MNANDKEFLVEKIRTQYIEKEHSEFDEIKKLDKEVKTPAILFAYIFGSIGAIIMGSGMSLVMTDIGVVLGIANGLVPGIIIGVIGLLMVIINYPVYNKILTKRRKKYADKILDLTEKIMKK